MKKLVFIVLCLSVGGFRSLLAGEADNDSLLDLLGALAEEQVSSVQDASPKAAVAPSPKRETLPEVAPPPVSSPAVDGDVIAELADELEAEEFPAPVEQPSRPTKITSRTAVYNRKEGLASFSGQVFLDDPQYQLHADRVYVFTTESNEVKRVVALGHVALTNELRSAYGAKATYSRSNGLVVLYSGDGITAEVVDRSKGEPQTVKGEKIRFWIDSEQVEVLKADISGPAPTGTMDVDTLKNIRRK